jgi:hypothetical protein
VRVVLVEGREPLAALIGRLAEGPGMLDVGSSPRLRSQGDWSLLRQRGARGVIVEVAAASRDAHDHLARAEGAHDAIRATLVAARAAGLPIRARTRVTRSNDRGLVGLAAWLAAAGVSGWRMSLARPTDEDTARRELPSLGIATPLVLRALDAARRAGLEVALEGFPLCVLGPFARWALPPREAPAPGQGPCDACPARPGCEGLSPLHRARFGARELRAVPPVPRDERLEPPP